MFEALRPNLKPIKYKQTLEDWNLKLPLNYTDCEVWTFFVTLVILEENGKNLKKKKAS